MKQSTVFRASIFGSGSVEEVPLENAGFSGLGIGIFYDKESAVEWVNRMFESEIDDAVEKVDYLKERLSNFKKNHCTFET